MIGTSDGLAFEDHMDMFIDAESEKPNMDIINKETNRNYGSDGDPQKIVDQFQDKGTWSDIKPDSSLDPISETYAYMKHLKQQEFSVDPRTNPIQTDKLLMQKMGGKSIQAEDIARFQDWMQNNPNVSKDPVFDPFRNTVKDKDQSRAPSNPTPKFNPASPEGIVASKIADKFGKGSDMEGQFKPIPEIDHIPDDWTDIVSPGYNFKTKRSDPNIKSSDDFLSNLPEDYEAFRYEKWRDERGPAYILRRKNTEPPKLEDLVS